MAYEEAEARRLVLDAGLQLVKEGLIARTWGNISARISDTEFIITPSGLAYESLRPEDLVKVKIADLSYEGSIKPSSEKGVHAAAYAIRPAADFIIHTHQFYASAVCAQCEDTDLAPCAAYGLPGTEKLRQAMSDCIAANPDKKAFLMARHGALCLGGSYDEAFALARELEENCRALTEQRGTESSPRKEKRPWLDDYAQLVGFGAKKAPEEDADAVRMITEKNAAAAAYVRNAKPLSLPDAALQRIVYLTKYSKQKGRKS